MHPTLSTKVAQCRRKKLRNCIDFSTFVICMCRDLVNNYQEKKKQYSEQAYQKQGLESEQRLEALGYSVSLLVFFFKIQGHN